MLTVSLFVSPILGLRNPTGVSQHTVQMAAALANRADVRVSWLAPGASLRALRPELPAAARDLPLQELPANETLTRRLLLSGLLATDRWSDRADWVYCPKEQPVTTRNSKLAVTVHDVLPFEPELARFHYRDRPTSRLRWTLLMRRVLRRADLIATVSAFTQRRLQELFDIDDHRIVVTGNGVQSDFFTQEERCTTAMADSHGIDRPYLLVVGGLCWRKGGDRLLQLARLLARDHADLDLLVTGRRHDEDLLSSLADSGLARVKMLGYVPREQLRDLLQRAEALVHLSRYEGFGMPVLEAMAARCPVVCTRAEALREVAGEAAWYVSGEDPEEARAAIEEARETGTARSERLQLGRSRARDFSWDRAAARLVDAMTRMA